MIKAHTSQLKLIVGQNLPSLFHRLHEYIVLIFHRTQSHSVRVDKFICILENCYVRNNLKMFVNGKDLISMFFCTTCNYDV